jgi:hypothetical protein
MSPHIKELTICGECQAYFCPDCQEAIKDYELCPAAGLLGVETHRLRFLKMLPANLQQHSGPVVQFEDEAPKTIKIINKNRIKIIDEEKGENE